MKIIVINGVGGVGKDTFVDSCSMVEGIDVINLSSVEYIKDIATRMGWDGVKNERGRRFLSDLKDAMTRYNDGPFLRIIDQIKEIVYDYESFDMPDDNLIIFVHCREPEEITRFEKEYGARSLLIRRPQVENLISNNHADTEVLYHDYNYTYWNINDLEGLKYDAKQLIKKIVKEDWRSWIDEGDY